MHAFLEGNKLDLSHLDDATLNIFRSIKIGKPLSEDYALALNHSELFGIPLSQLCVQDRVQDVNNGILVKFTKIIDTL